MSAKIEFKDGRLVKVNQAQEDSDHYFRDFDEKTSSFILKLKVDSNGGRCRCVYDYNIYVLDKDKTIIANYPVCISCNRLYTHDNKEGSQSSFHFTHKDLDSLLAKDFQKCKTKSLTFNTIEEGRAFINEGEEIKKSIHNIAPDWMKYDGQFSTIISSDVLQSEALKDWETAESTLKSRLPDYDFKASLIFAMSSTGGSMEYQITIDCVHGDYVEICNQIFPNHPDWTPYNEIILNLIYRP